MTGADALSLAAPGRAEVHLSLVGSTSGIDREALNDVVTSVARANVAKLGRSGADGRHLFVWVDSTMGSVEMLMHLGHLPEKAPVLPPSISAVWAAVWGPGLNYGTNTARLWRAIRPAAWEVLDVPSFEQ